MINITEGIVLKLTLAQTGGMIYADGLRSLWYALTEEEMPRGTCTNLLHRMETKGLVEVCGSQPASGKGGNRRLLYRVTRTGKVELASLRDALAE